MKNLFKIVLSLPVLFFIEARAGPDPGKSHYFGSGEIFRIWTDQKPQH